MCVRVPTHRSQVTNFAASGTCRTLEFTICLFCVLPFHNTYMFQVFASLLELPLLGVCALPLRHHFAKCPRFPRILQVSSLYQQSCL